MTSNEQIDSHIAHEEKTYRTPASHGGVPDDADVGKTATPEQKVEWVNTGGTYGGLRERVDDGGKTKEG